MTAASQPTGFAQARADGVHVFGAGRFARDLAHALQCNGVAVHGFLTSDAPTQPQLDGLPLRAADARTLAQAPLCIGVFNREAHSDYAALRRWLLRIDPAARIVWPQTAYGWLQAQLGFRFWLHPTPAYAAAAGRIERARARFDDEASRVAFDRVLAFRSDPAAHAEPPPPQGGVQYLPTWLCEHLAGGALRVVDGGAYRGETLRELATLLPIEQAWTFEPDAANHAALVRELADWPTQATHLPAGLSDSPGVIGFASGQGEASHFVTDGDGARGGPRVPVVSLDGCLHRAPVNFIKLDVEGHELQALAGARLTLQRQRPTLAIAAYHRWDDLWRLPEFIAETGLNYRFRLGLHGHNSFDAVLYAY